jgi:hypothetical protein
MFTRQKLLNLVTLVRHYKNEFTYYSLIGSYSPAPQQPTKLDSKFPRNIFITQVQLVAKKNGKRTFS